MNFNTVPQPAPPPAPRLLVPAAPVLVADGGKIAALSTAGELETLSFEAARALLQRETPILCNAPYLAARLGLESLAAYDVLELFAFVHPGRFAAPTPRGLSKALGLLEPDNAEDECLSLRDCLRHLLSDLTLPGLVEKSDPAAIAAMMSPWAWRASVLAALGKDPALPRGPAPKIWENLPEWSIHAPQGAAGTEGVSAEEASDRLDLLLRRKRQENRPEQRQYAAALTEAFAPLTEEGETRVVLAEAGTGVGKTLGYLAPATVWAEKNGGAVWVSTYTRNLQRQVDAELDRLHEDPVEKMRKVVVRKGRENYLCLLNLEDAALQLSDKNAAALGLILRWAAATEDGDFAGKDFPGWLSPLIGRGRAAALADRRGECIYAACPHFNKCFIEKSTRKAKRADIVVANHALVLQRLAGGEEDVSWRYVFDEGHHLFDAADEAFAQALTGASAAELRRWILGAEGGGRTRARGLKRRVDDLIAADEQAQEALDALRRAAQALPAAGWRTRLAEDKPKGATEEFLAACRQQVLARAGKEGTHYSLETPVQPPLPAFAAAARALSLQLDDLRRPLAVLSACLRKLMDDKAAELDAAQRERIRHLISSLSTRAANVIAGWQEMLAGDMAGMVDWLEITRADGHEYDAGLHRRLADPARVFAETLKARAAGVVVTSASLRDASESDPGGWQSALSRTGFAQDAATRVHYASPYDHPAQTRILVVTDVRKEEPAETAAAMRELFTASGGGALGVFTAVQRLRAAHEKLAPALESRGLRLYAQHVDPLDVSTLIDIFREEENACLLGTDATRDGIDVPGRSLRLVVYDRVPWPRPTILHKARRALFGGMGYDDMLTRFRLKQAYGRLIRRADDKGVFVMLDGALPSRLLGAFPPGVEVRRVTLAEAVALTAGFLPRID